MPAHPSRRDDAPAFDPKMFYRLTPNTRPKDTLSAGTFTDSNSYGNQGVVSMNTTAASSSENWQIYYQSGRYFIRNYDWTPDWQLGLSDDSTDIPKMYYASGKMSQQWTINKVNGGWALMNGLSVDGSFLSSPSDLPYGGPIMKRESSGQVWNITANLSAVKAKAVSIDWTRGDWFKDVTSFQSPSPTPTPSASATSISTTTASLTSPNSISSAFPHLPASSTTTPPTASPSSSLPSGAIAGIAIGGVALLAALIFALWFFLVKKKRASAHRGAPYEVDGNSPPMEKYAYHSELASPLVELAGKERETVNNRFEMDSSYAVDNERAKIGRG